MDGRLAAGPMPADHPARVGFKQQFQGLRREAPVIAWVPVDVEVERARYQKSAIGAQDAPHLVEAAPETRHMFKGAHGDDGADRCLGKRQILHVGYLIHTGAGP